MYKKNFLLLLILFINTCNTFAQIFNESVLPNLSNEIMIDISSDNYGNYFISGRISDDNNHVEGFVKKISHNGNLLNVFNLQNFGENSFFNKSILINSNLIVLGVKNKSTGDVIMYVKLDSNLNLIETVEVPFLQNRIISYYNFLLDPDSTIVISGYSRSNNNSINIRQPFFYKISQSGDSLYSKYVNTTNNQFIYQMHLSNDSNRYIAFMDGFNPDLGYSGILHLNKNFDTLEHHLFSEYVLHDFASLRINDSIFISSTINIDPPHELRVCLINEYGYVSDYINFSRSNSMREYPSFSPGISKNNSNYYIGATSNFDYTNPFYSNIDSWFHLIKMDENLNVFWEKWYGGDAYYSLNSVLATSDGGCLMVGTKYPHGIGNQFIQGHYIKVDANGDVQWTQDIEIPELSYKVYPNPTQSGFNIENNELNIQSIELYDISGRYLKSIQDCNNSTISIDLTPFSNGIYFAKIKSTNGVRTEKVVKN